MRVPLGEVVGQATSFGCEMCLDLVLIAETYAECDEVIPLFKLKKDTHFQSKIKDKMEYECDLKYGRGTPADKACRASVDQIAHVSNPLATFYANDSFARSL